MIAQICTEKPFVLMENAYLEIQNNGKKLRISFRHLKI